MEEDKPTTFTILHEIRNCNCVKKAWVACILCTREETLNEYKYIYVVVVAAVEVVVGSGSGGDIIFYFFYD